MESYFKTKSIFNLIAKWKWHLLIITVVAAILGYVFSCPYFIHPKFKSSATLYPANIICHSDESESEQMLQILESDDIKFQIIEKFDLYSHYKIDTNATSSLAKMMSYYKDNVIIEKTPNDAIMITVCDEDPQVAADMVNSIIEDYDNLVLKINAEKSREIFEIYSKAATVKEHIIDSLSDILKKYGTEYGMIDVKSQTRSLNESSPVIKNWQEYRADFTRTDTLLKSTIKRYSNDLNICEDAYRDINKKQTYSHIISKPYVADKKFYPIRWIISLFCGIGGCLIGIIAIAIIEGCRKPKEEVDTQD